MTDTSQPTAARRRSRMTLVGLAALFFLPLVLAWLVYLNPAWIKGGDTTNYGTLVQPPRPLPELPVAALDGSLHELSGRKNHWTLLQVMPSECTDVCRQTMYRARQVRLSLARDMKRVGRVLLVTGDAVPDAALLAEYPDLVVVRASPDQRGTIDALLEPDQGGAVPLDGRLFIIDPLGNLMMAYPPELDMKGLQKDLKRLLKASYVG